MGRLGTAVKAGQTAIELGRNVHGLTNAASEFRAADQKDLGRKAGRHAFNEGADAGKEMGKTWLKTFEVIPRLICRGLQALLAIIACGIYGGHGWSPEWSYAIVVAIGSILTSVFFLGAATLGGLPYIGSRLKLLKTYRAFAWDLILFVMWIIVFGIFAFIFLKRDSEDPYKETNTHLMKAAVWIDFTNAILWLISGAYGAMKTFVGDKADVLTDKMGQKMFEKKKAPAKDMGYAESV